MLYNRKKSHTYMAFLIREQLQKNIVHVRNTIPESHTILNLMPTQNYSNDFMPACLVIGMTYPVYSLTFKSLISYPDFFGLFLAIW